MSDFSIYRNTVEQQQDWREADEAMREMIESGRYVPDWITDPDEIESMESIRLNPAED